MKEGFPPKLQSLLSRIKKKKSKILKKKCKSLDVKKMTEPDKGG